MAKRLYLPRLRYLLKKLDVYMTRWDAQIRSGMSTTNQTYLDNVQASVAALRAGLGPDPIDL
jgi:hypothetical protein